MAHNWLHPSRSAHSAHSDTSEVSATTKKSKLHFLDSVLKHLAPEVQVEKGRRTSVAMIGRVH